MTTSWNNQDFKENGESKTWADADVTWADAGYEWDGNTATIWSDDTKH